MDSEPARLLRDDAFGAFAAAENPRGFLDGGDLNRDGARQTGETPTDPVDVLLVARGSLPPIASDASGVDVGGRTLADEDGGGVYHLGDGIVVNLSEPFFALRPTVNWLIDPIVRLFAPETNFLVQPGAPARPGAIRWTAQLRGADDPHRMTVPAVSAAAYSAGIHHWT